MGKSKRARGKRGNTHTVVRNIFTVVERQVARGDLCKAAQNRASVELAQVLHVQEATESGATSNGGTVPELVVASSSTETADTSGSAELVHKEQEGGPYQ